MSELRQDPLTRRWAVIAPERNNQPIENNQIEKLKSSFCPFCPGNEDETLPEILAVRKSGGSNSPGWEIRVIPNRFPILRIEGDLNKEAEGPYSKMDGIGAHEIIIESPDHSQDLHQLSFDQVRLILSVSKERMIDLGRDKRFRYVLLFKNFGTAAGTLLEHPHIQLNAFPIIPFEPELELQCCRDHFEHHKRCLLCDIIRYESLVASRIIVADQHFIAFCPFASRFPYEIMIMPQLSYHQAFFTEIGDLPMKALVSVLQLVLKKLESTPDFPHYNLVLHMAPYGGTIKLDYHWHIHILPRLTKIAGFELGAQFFINPVYPELAAKQLRETTV